MGAEDLIGAGLKLGTGSNKIIIWIFIIIIIFGFGNGRKACNLNFKGCEVKEEKCYSSHRKCRKNRSSSCHYKHESEGCIGTEGFGNGVFSKIFGNNGLFIIIIIALIVLCKEKKETTD